MRGNWLETLLTVAEQRGIDARALLHVTTTQGAQGWWIDWNQFVQLLQHELDWHGVALPETGGLS